MEFTLSNLTSGKGYVISLFHVSYAAFHHAYYRELMWDVYTSGSAGWTHDIQVCLML